LNKNALELTISLTTKNPIIQKLNKNTYESRLHAKDKKLIFKIRIISKSIT